MPGCSRFAQTTRTQAAVHLSLSHHQSTASRSSRTGTHAIRIRSARESASIAVHLARCRAKNCADSFRDSTASWSHRLFSWLYFVLFLSSCETSLRILVCLCDAQVVRVSCCASGVQHAVGCKISAVKRVHLRQSAMKPRAWSQVARSPPLTDASRPCTRRRG